MGKRDKTPQEAPGGAGDPAGIDPPAGGENEALARAGASSAPVPRHTATADLPLGDGRRVGSWEVLGARVGVDAERRGAWTAVVLARDQYGHGVGWWRLGGSSPQGGAARMSAVVEEGGALVLVAGAPAPDGVAAAADSFALAEALLAPGVLPGTAGGTT